MYCRDTQLLRTPTRRLRWMRAIANAGVFFLSVMIGVATLFALVFGTRTDLTSPVWVAVILPLGLLAWVGGMVNIVYFVGWYRVRCPCCDEVWAPRFSVWIEAQCQNCGYDCTTGHRAGDF